jgi:hypothetical protein
MAQAPKKTVKTVPGFGVRFAPGLKPRVNETGGKLTH